MGKFKAFGNDDYVGFIIHEKTVFILLQIIPQSGAGRNLNVLVNDSYIDLAVFADFYPVHQQGVDDHRSTIDTDISADHRFLF